MEESKEVRKDWNLTPIESTNRKFNITILCELLSK